MADVANLQVVVGADVSDAEKGLSSLGAKVESFGSGLAKAFGGAAIAGVVGFTAAIGESVREAADFEKTMSGVKAVSGATTEQMKELSALALQLGKDTSFSATEAAQGIEELTKAGVDMSDIMGGAAKSALDLAAAGGVSVADAATIAANAMNLFNLHGPQMAHVADLIAGAANASAIDVTDFKFSLQSVGAVAHQLGLSLDDTTVAIAELGKAGLTGSDAGTSLRTMLMRLQPQTKEQTELMKKLGIITKDGSNQFFDAAGNAKGMSAIQGVLQKALAGQTKQQQQATLATLFGSDAIRAATILTEAGSKGYDDMAESMAKVSAESVAADRLDNVSGSLEKLKGSLSTAAITVGLALTPALKALVDYATDLVNAWMPTIDAFAQALPAAIESTIAAAGDMLKELGDLVGGFVGLELDDYAAGWDTWTGAVQRSVDVVTSALEPAMIWLTTTGWPLLQGVMTTFQMYLSQIFVPAWQTLWNWLSPQLQNALQWLIATGFPATQTAITAVADWLNTTGLPALASLWNWLSPKLQAALTWLTDEGWPAVGGAMNAVQNWIEETLVPWLTAVWNWLSPKFQEALNWLTNTGWPAFQTAMTTVSDWVTGPFYETLSTLWDWLSPKLQAAINWLVITGWPALTDAMRVVWQWLQDNFSPAWEALYGWLTPKLSDIVTWFTAEGWPKLKQAGSDLAQSVADLVEWYEKLFTAMEKRGVFNEMKLAWDDLVAVGDKLWREILYPLVQVLSGDGGVTASTRDATDAADDYAASWLDIVKAIRYGITWLDHLVDILILSIDGWKALGTAAQWAARAAGAKVTGGDVPDFPDLTRRPIWLDKGDDGAPAISRHGPGGSSGGAAPPTIAPAPAPAPEPSPPPVSIAPPPAPPPASPGSSLHTGNEVHDYIVDAAIARGIDPSVAIRIADHEGSSTDKMRVGIFDTGRSFWPFQLHYGGAGTPWASWGTVAGMGNDFTARTGWQPYDVNAWAASTDWALNVAAKSGWGQWYGRGPAGVGIWEGIPGHMRGGWVGLHGPELGVLGEGGPEYVIPNRALRSGGGGVDHHVIELKIGGRIAEQIYVEGRDLAIRYGRAPAGAA